MEYEDHYEFETAEQFWQSLDKTLSQPCDTHELIDDALRSYLALTTRYPAFVESETDLRRCAYELYSSPLFGQHAEYIRTQFVHCLLQDDEPDILHITSTFLLADARENDSTFELLNSVGAFPRMVDLIRAPKGDGEEGLHRLLMELMYEMARIQKITNADLVSVNDDFISCLFDIIEQVSGDVNDPYHYPVIRVLLVLNEQFMVAAHDPATVQPAPVPLTNKVIKVLSSHGSKFKTFGENIILLLNREDETSLQLLTLKLLYLLFTTPSTYEYFYTNDLHVLVDILIRNLLDLPEEAAALRHTYLRVLYPLLEHTQLQQPPHYKREELRKLLSVMAGGNAGDGMDAVFCHFEDVDDTTKRLVKRCQTVNWLIDPATNIPQAESPVDVGPMITISSTSPTRTSKPPPAVPAPRKLRKRTSSKGSDVSVGPYLTTQLDSARQSNLSMMEMAAQREKPGVKTPSRHASIRHGLRGMVMQKKEKPPPPKARRSGPKKAPLPEITAVEVANAVLDAASQTSQEEHTHTQDEPEPNTKGIKPCESSAAEGKSKRPPPTPKARRWRGKRAKEEDEGGGTVKEPGKFKADLPSLNTTSPDLSYEQSPFSPPVEKTLSPDTGEEVDLLSKTKSKRISSVSAALSQAQVQAIQNIEETLEKAHIDMAATHSHPNPDNQPPAAVRQESPPLTRVVLAPPGPAPQRGVPGPRIELERSPFLSDNESEEVISGAAPDGGLPRVSEDDEFEHPPPVPAPAPVETPGGSHGHGHSEGNNDNDNDKDAKDTGDNSESEDDWNELDQD